MVLLYVGPILPTRVRGNDPTYFIVNVITMIRVTSIAIAIVTMRSTKFSPPWKPGRPSNTTIPDLPLDDVQSANRAPTLIRPAVLSWSCLYPGKPGSSPEQKHAIPRIFFATLSVPFSRNFPTLRNLIWAIFRGKFLRFASTSPCTISLVQDEPV